MTTPNQAYATADDLEARWRTLSDDEKVRANTLLADASYWVRQWFPVETRRIDAGQAESTGVKILVCAMVKRAMISLNDDGTSSETETYGPFSHTRAFSNPSGNLYILDSEAQMIQGRASGFMSMRMKGAW
ncbi:Gp19/Gp15/Gp42 family protein [Tsukamurella sputi]|uniref:Gp19/Gp15/Gp42 family protein n=1 Tax=Tsukamurella sputi TaxID=2591848 RepID=UPI0013158AC0|nr:Gp19/Gp15/Gp42 family protein [Tsukamurella sputi]